MTSFIQSIVSGKLLLGHSYYCSRTFFPWHPDKQCLRLWLFPQASSLNGGVNSLSTCGEPTAGATNKPLLF